MATMSSRHKELDEQGIGKCSVPMWMNGMPAGFCDEPAYGEPPPCRRYRTYWGELRREDGRYSGYVPALACPRHGGPDSRVYRDGNAWCAVRPDFVDIQTSPAGFGDTPEEARSALREIEKRVRG